MKTEVFVDTDVILDLLTRREPFYQASAQLFSLADRGDIKVYVSSLCFANLYYILRKALTGAKAVEALKKFRQLVTVLPVDDHVLSQALDSGFTDFEDALQYHTAMYKAVTCLITRNVKDYRKAGMTICTAGEFLAGRNG